MILTRVVFLVLKRSECVVVSEYLGYVDLRFDFSFIYVSSLNRLGEF